MPKRYSYTTTGRCSFSPWMDNEYTYSIQQINLGYNSMSRLEVVSMLNILSQGIEMFSYSTSRTPKYNPKLYLGTALQTIAAYWLNDLKSTPSGVGQSTQKQVFGNYNL